MRNPIRAKIAWNALYLNTITPSAVPRVFVTGSVIPESLVGRNACRTSIVRLTINPNAIGSPGVHDRVIHFHDSPTSFP